MKQCNICKENKSLVNFSKDKSTKDGFMSKCKKCHKNHYLKNKDKILEHLHKYYLNNKELIISKAYKWRKNNPHYFKEYISNSENREKHTKNTRIYSLINSEKVKKYHQEYFKTPKGKSIRKAVDFKRRAGGLLDSALIQQVYENNIKKYGILTCELCKNPIKLGEDSIDHFTPICRAKEFPNIEINSLVNLGVAHGVNSQEKCNSKKYDKTLEEWLNEKIS